jgi:hypothetical protein
VKSFAQPVYTITGFRMAKSTCRIFPVALLLDTQRRQSTVVPTESILVLRAVCFEIQYLPSLRAVFRSRFRLVFDMPSKRSINLLAGPESSGCSDTLTAEGRPRPLNNN